VGEPITVSIRARKVDIVRCSAAPASAMRRSDIRARSVMRITPTTSTPCDAFPTMFAPTCSTRRA
jgi:hypothetical protein